MQRGEFSKYEIISVSQVRQKVLFFDIGETRKS